MAGLVLQESIISLSFHPMFLASGLPLRHKLPAANAPPPLPQNLAHHATPSPSLPLPPPSPPPGLRGCGALLLLTSGRFFPAVTFHYSWTESIAETRQFALIVTVPESAFEVGVFMC